MAIGIGVCNVRARTATAEPVRGIIIQIPDHQKDERREREKKKRCLKPCSAIQVAHHRGKYRKYASRRRRKRQSSSPSHSSHI